MGGGFRIFRNGVWVPVAVRLGTIDGIRVGETQLASYEQCLQEIAPVENDVWVTETIKDNPGTLDAYTTIWGAIYS